jgi:hypothetical protein
VVDYSVFMAVMMVLMLERVEKRPIFAEIAYVSVFRVSPPPPLGIVEGGGGVYI